MTIRRLTGSGCEIKHGAERPGDVKHSMASIKKLRAAGFTPTGDFNAGLAATIDFFKKKQYGYFLPALVVNFGQTGNIHFAPFIETHAVEVRAECQLFRQRMAKLVPAR